jgi:hypothetical protein
MWLKQQSPLLRMSCLCCSIFAIGIILFVSVAYSTHETSTPGLTKKIKSTATTPFNYINVEGNATTGDSMSADATFSAIGTISSLNFVNNSIPDIATAKKIVLSGYWSLHVNNGRLAFFEADFVAAPVDGNISHTHQITDFIPNNNTKPIQLSADGSTAISGTADVRINGINIWDGVNATILISKGSTITISLDDIMTKHHFGSQPIYGIVNRLMF